MSLAFNYDESENSIPFDLTGFLARSDIDFTFDDITEATYWVKNALSDCNVDAVITKTIGNGITPDSSNNYMNVKFEDSDFDSLEIAKLYFHGMSVKTATMTGFLTVKPQDQNLSTIVFVSQINNPC